MNWNADNLRAKPGLQPVTVSAFFFFFLPHRYCAVKSENRFWEMILSPPRTLGFEYPRLQLAWNHSPVPDQSAQSTQVAKVLHGNQIDNFFFRITAVAERMGAVCMMSWYPKFNGSHFGLPPVPQLYPPSNWTGWQLIRVNYDVDTQAPFVHTSFTCVFWF